MMSLSFHTKIPDFVHWADQAQWPCFGKEIVFWGAADCALPVPVL